MLFMIMYLCVTYIGDTCVVWYAVNIARGAVYVKSYFKNVAEAAHC
jgi:hypothetical protein